MIRAVHRYVRHALVFRIDAGLSEELRNLLGGQLRMGEVGRVRSSFAMLAMAVVAFVRLEAAFSLGDEGALLAGSRTAGGRCAPGWSLRTQGRSQESQS